MARPRTHVAAVADLNKQSKAVPLKLTIPLEHQRAAFLALGLDPLDGQIRLVHFFETPELALQDAGVVVRARRVQGKGDDSVVKLRPCVPTDLPKEVRKSENLKVEMDITSQSHVVSASLKGASSCTSASQ